MHKHSLLYQRSWSSASHVPRQSHNIEPKYFFAPSHTFDDNTLKALKDHSAIRIISDTLGFEPYIKDEFVYIPQLGGHCAKRRMTGIWTFCLHPNMMNDEDFIKTEEFIKDHHTDFISFSDIDYSNLKKKSLKSKLFSWLYFAQRKMRNLK